MNINDPLTLKIEVPAEVVKKLVENYIQTKIPSGGKTLDIRFVVGEPSTDMRGEPMGPRTLSKAIATVETSL
jgi:hypothetical protein